MARMPLSGVMGLEADMADTAYDDKYGGAVVMEDGQMSTAMELGQPHIAIGGMLFLIIGLVYVAHKNLGLSSIRYTLMDIFGIWFIALTGNVLAKVAVAKLTASGVVLPGVPETIALG